jgi:hypothetical protein
MNAVEHISNIMRKWVLLVLAVWLVQPAFAAKPGEETFDVLRTRTATYTNVTVTSRAETYIFIVHSKGMSSVKVQDLPLETQRRLGYTAAEPSESAMPEVAARPLIGGDQKTDDPPPATEKGPIHARTLLAIAVGIIALLVVFAFILKAFSKKAPVVQQKFKAEPLQTQ